MAYRGSAPSDTPRGREDEGGIVADMVRQFADPYAFLRELVQNAIDAGATRIDVTIERDGDDVVRTSVEDDGCGMSRATIEGPLLTLFSSSKESDSSKIGKYGIGFVSVFALDPMRVEVRTRRDGEGWLVRLFPDHAFELARDGTPAGHGTTVTLVQRMSGVGVELHQSKCREALARWCRFAHVPIALREDGPGTSARAINEPLSVTGLVAVTRQVGGERIVVATGTTAGGGDVLTGYYNRGLTLVELAQTPPGLAGVRVAIDSPKLSHTLSRDNVKQDRELERVLAVVRELVRHDLRDALEARIAEAARAGSAEYPLLLSAANAPAFEEAARMKPSLMLVEPMDGATTLTSSQIVVRSRGGGGNVLFADASSLLTRALARAGRPVVRGTETMADVRRFLGGLSVAPADLAWSLAVPAEAHPKDDELARAIGRALRVAGRPVARVLFASFEGAWADAAFRVIPSDRGEPLVTASEAASTTFTASSDLWLGVSDAAVRLARRRALTDVRAAAHLLARVLLLASGPIDARAVDALLAAAGGDDA